MSASLNCPICDGAAAVKAHARLAPFIATLIGSTINQATKLLSCATCDFDFFEKRYSTEEDEAIYSEYRTGKYLKVRQNWEPWYTNSVNEAYVPENPSVDVRVNFMEEVISHSLVGPSLDLVVDVGGDQGQFFPKREIKNKVVIDLSNKKLRPGVSRIGNMGQLKSQADLIIAAHLLEHLSDPQAFLVEMRSHLRPGGHIYLEVPLDRPAIRKWHSSNTYAKYLKAINSKPVFVFLDFLTGVLRNFGFTVPRIGIVKESEHINYFSSNSLEKIAIKSGYTIIHSAQDNSSRAGFFRLGKAGLIAQHQS